MKAFIALLCLIVLVSSQCGTIQDPNGAKYNLRSISGKIFKASGLPDVKDTYNYEFSICTDEVECGKTGKASLCQEWDPDGKSSIGKFKSVSAPQANQVQILLEGGDEIPGKGPRTATFDINCDKTVKDITLVSVNYAGTGANYKAVSKSVHGCPGGGGGAGVAILVIIIIILILGGVAGAVYWFVLKPRMDSQI